MTPPSTNSSWPATKLLSSDARNSTAWATSSASLSFDHPVCVATAIFLVVCPGQSSKSRITHLVGLFLDGISVRSPNSAARTSLSCAGRHQLHHEEAGTKVAKTCAFFMTLLPEGLIVVERWSRTGDGRS
jgi:hypothetical protein